MSGLKQEIHFSREFHSEGVAVLVSHRLLRLRNSGQIDLARMRKDKEGWVLEVGEVKSSEIGEASSQLIQKRRLFSSQCFLAGLFGCRTKLISLY